MLTVGLGIAGMRYIEHMIDPAAVHLVAITPDGPLPADAKDIEFLVASGVEFSAARLKDIFAAAANVKVLLAAAILSCVSTPIPTDNPHTRVQVIQTLSAGVNAIVHYVPDGAVLCNASGSHDVAVAEWCMGVILAQLRQLPAFWQAQQQARWEPATRQLIQRGQADVGVMDDLEGKQVLVLGHGSIGRALEARLKPFGACVTGIARTVRPGVRSLGELDELLPTADIVVVLLPLTPETHHIVDAAFLAKMQRGALLVNAGRGLQVDTDALLEALRSGHVRAALDVTDPEPLPDGHPLWSAPGIIITPHIGGAVRSMRVRGYKFVVRQIERYMAGEKLENVRLHGY